MPSARIAAASENMQRVGFGQVEDDDLPADREERNNHHGPNLHDAVRALRHDKKGLLEFERDYHREDHAEHSLEDRVVGGVEAARMSRSPNRIFG